MRVIKKSEVREIIIGHVELILIYLFDDFLCKIAILEPLKVRFFDKKQKLLSDDGNPCPFLEEYNLANIPEEVCPTPLPPIVDGAELVSSSDEVLAARVAAEMAGGLLLHNYLLTLNAPPLQRSKGGKVLLADMALRCLI